MTTWRAASFYAGFAAENHISILSIGDTLHPYRVHMLACAVRRNGLPVEARL